MLKKTYLLTIVLQLFTVYIFSQTKTVEIWFDPYRKTMISERYSVLTSNFDIKHGAYKSYSREGAITAEGNYNNGQRTGKWTFRLGNNFVTSVENYNDKGERHGLFTASDVINGQGKGLEGNYVNGKKNGVWKEWWCVRDYPNVLKYEGSYIDGKANGYWKHYYENGKVEKEGNYTDESMTGEWKFYSAEGTLTKTGTYIKDKESGTFTFYDAGGSGEKISEGNYVNGKRVGKWKILFDKNWKETSYRSKAEFYRNVTFNELGVADGKVTDYYITGEKQFEGQLLAGKDNILDGDCIFYHKNGKVQGERSYSNGKPSGTWKEYYDTGEKLSVTDYSTGHSTMWSKTGTVSEEIKQGNRFIYDEQGVITKVKTADGRLMDGAGLQKSEILQLLIHIKQGIPNARPFVFSYGEAVSFDSESQMFSDFEYNYMANPNFEFKTELKAAQEAYQSYSSAREQKDKSRYGKIVTDNLYKIVNNSSTISKKSQSITSQRKETTDYFNADKQNKVLAEKAEIVFQSYNKAYSAAENSDKKVEVLNKMEALYSKMSSLKSTDNTELISQLKKAKSSEEIIGILKI